jgi:hypothetical protein
MPPKRNLAERFWEKVAKGEGCWEWQATLKNGYGGVRINEQTVYAHRIAYELSNGPIPDGLFVMHSCDNRKCCNPAHLSLGTPLDNVRDMHHKGRNRQPRGVRNTNAKLTPEAVLYIRKHHHGNTQELARRFGVKENAIRGVLNGRCWSWVKEDSAA